MRDKIYINKTTAIDLPKLIESRLLVQANSGAGKSWLLRRILEQSHGKVQQIVIDLEGEFGTLREKYDYILAGKGGDTPAEVRSAALLARRLLELKVSAIIDLYELPPQERKRFVRLFLESMINAPKELYHPCLVVIDEAHVFAPEKGESEAMSAVIDLATRGRKRGYCAILATQRISKLHKDASAECNNKLIGRSSQDIDMKRAAEELGFTSKEDMRSLRTLAPGEFYAFGTAISNEVQKVMVGDVKTSHPKIGARGFSATTIPPTDKIRSILGKLADLPKEAESEAKTVAEFKKEIGELRRELRGHKCPVVNPNPVKVERIKVPMVGKRTLEGLKVAETKMRKMLNMTKDSVLIIQANIDKLSFELKKIENTKTPVVNKEVPVTYQIRPNNRPSTKEFIASNPKLPPLEGGLTTPECRILNATAWLESVGVSDLSKPAVAFLAGYTFGSGGFNNPCGSLRTKGLIEYRGGSIVLTETGRQMAEIPDTPLTTEELHKKVMSVLPTPEQRVLKPLLESYPESITHEELAERSGYIHGSGGFNNPRGRLRTLGLIDYLPGNKSIARSILFLE